MKSLNLKTKCIKQANVRSRSHIHKAKRREEKRRKVMHGDRGNIKIVWLMLFLCVFLHVGLIPVWMWYLGL